MANDNTSDLGKSLEALYLKGDFQSAQKLLLEHKTDFAPGIFHFNFGTMQAKMGNLAAGRYHLEKALKEGNIDGKVFHNLEVVKSQLALSDISNSGSYWDKTLDMSLTLPSSLFISLALLLGIVFLALLKLRKITKWYSVSFFLFLAILPLVFLIVLKQFNYAIVLTDAPLREGPSKVYSEISKVKAGSKIIISDKDNNGWFYIKGPSSINGWVHNDDLGRY